MMSVTLSKALLSGVATVQGQTKRIGVDLGHVASCFLTRWLGSHPICQWDYPKSPGRLVKEQEVFVFTKESTMDKRQAKIEALSIIVDKIQTVLDSGMVHEEQEDPRDADRIYKELEALQWALQKRVYKLDGSL